MEATSTAAKVPTAAREIINVNELLKKPYLNEFEAAALTGRSVCTLRNDRFLRRGLPVLYVAKRTIRYKLTDVIAFMEGRRITFDEPART